MEAVYQEIHREVIELSKTGNGKAQKQLYQLYSKAMHNICYRFMNSKAEAEDMLQEAFIEAFMKLDSFRYESSFGAWLKRITINKCINALKKRKTELILTESLPEVAETIEEENLNMINIKVNNIQNALEKLPDGYRLVFSLYMLEGYDHSEISEIIGISESTSKSQYSRAKQKLKEILKTADHEG